MSMKTKEAGFRIRDSGRKSLPGDGSLPDASEARRGHEVDRDRNRSSLLDYSTFDSRLLTEQTGNVDEKKGPSQKVEESRFDNSRSPRLVARSACQLLDYSTFDSRLSTLDGTNREC
jgi:hypothetical protein